jgi:hypothetical protein
MFFGEERQMLPPYMTDGQNTAERFLSNMDYAQVSAAVITQEFIDGVQNAYLMQNDVRTNGNQYITLAEGGEVTTDFPVLVPVKDHGCFLLFLYPFTAIQAPFLFS